MPYTPMQLTHGYPVHWFTSNKLCRICWFRARGKESKSESLSETQSQAKHRFCLQFYCSWFSEQSQSLIPDGCSDGLFHLCHWLQQSSFHWMINDTLTCKRYRAGRNGNVPILPTSIPSSLWLWSKWVLIQSENVFVSGGITKILKGYVNFRKWIDISNTHRLALGHGISHHASMVCPRTFFYSRSHSWRSASTPLQAERRWTQTSTSCLAQEIDRNHHW